MNKTENKPIAIIPIKDFTSGKGRLRSTLKTLKSLESLKELNKEIFINTLSETLQVLPDVCVVSTSQTVMSLSKEIGATMVMEDQGMNLNESLTLACQKCMELGWNSTLIIMADLPLFSSKLLTQVLSKIRKKAKFGVIIPSKTQIKGKDVFGTTILFQQPSLCFPLCFGEKSYVKHLESAKKFGVHLQTINHKSLAFDLDIIDDVVCLGKKEGIFSATPKQFDSHIKKILSENSVYMEKQG